MEEILSRISIMLVPALLAITMHEVMHGYVADRCGDPTARLLGRLTLNPVRHLDPIGTLAILFFGFGWARPVPVNTRNLRRARRDMIWVSLAGPLANLFVAAASALLLHGLAFLDASSAPTWLVPALRPLSLMAGFSLYINVILGIFNLMPLPPLDGGRVLAGILPPRQAEWLARIEPFGFVIVLFLVFFTDVWAKVLGPLIAYLVTLMAGSQVGAVEQAMHFLFGQ
ncbi:MAG: site-2 protease family protein [Desulfuromonas sp.]|nr:MAG: site-2 protease family protein [Desulfuromonas sp.]